MSKKKIFIDSDVFLDSMLFREPYYKFSNKILNLCEKREVLGHTSSLIIANLYYILRKVSNNKKAIDAISKIREIITVLPLTNTEIGESINADFKDFEDGIQYFIALNHKIDYLITRNKKDFKKSLITIMSPKEYLLI